MEVQPVGFNLGGTKQAGVQVPQMEPGRMELPLRVGSAMTNPVPFLLWWVALAAVIAEALMVAMRLLRGGARGPNTGAPAQRSRSG